MRQILKIFELFFSIKLIGIDY